MAKVCINCGHPAENMHHVVPKCLGGKEGSNLVALCCACHGLVHERDMVKHRRLQKIGIEAAKKVEGKFRGRKPTYNRATLESVLHMLNIGVGPTRIGREVGLSRMTIHRIKDDPLKAVDSLKSWGMWDG